MALKKRGKLYIDRDVQQALLWQLLRHWTIFLVVLVAMLLIISHRTRTRGLPPARRRRDEDEAEVAALEEARA